jgi:hypothetical protein
MCSLHPGRASAATCERCGAFICEEDRRTLNGRTYCPACAVRPEVDYLEAFRLKHWGKRDGWAWLIGVGALLNGVGSIGQVVQESWLEAASSLMFAAVGGCYFFGQVWARVALFALPVLSAVVVVAAMPEEMEANGPVVVGVVMGRSLIPLAVLAAMFLDTRNKLFFKLPVSQEKLQRAWDLYANNRMARAGFLLSFLGLVVPGVAVVALVLSIVGLQRVDPLGHPPIGRKGQAIAGIVLGVVGLVTGGAILLAMLR